MKIRFGEISIGEQFEYSGLLMVKTHEYNAQTVTDRGKQAFLFQKKDLVSKKSLIPIWIPNLMAVSFQRNLLPMCVPASYITAFDILGVQPMSGPGYTIDGDRVQPMSEPEGRIYALDLKYQGFNVKYRKNLSEITERFSDFLDNRGIYAKINPSPKNSSPEDDLARLLQGVQPTPEKSRPEDAWDRLLQGAGRGIRKNNA